MDKEDVAHIYSGILTIKRNEIELFVIELFVESLIQNEVRKRKTNTVC